MIWTIQTDGSKILVARILAFNERCQIGQCFMLSLVKSAQKDCYLVNGTFSARNWKTLGAFLKSVVKASKETAVSKFLCVFKYQLNVCREKKD